MIKIMVSCREFVENPWLLMLPVDGKISLSTVEATFKGHVDFSNSTIPTLPVDGNLTADDAVVNTLAVEAKTTFNHVDFSKVNGSMAI